MTKLFRLVGSLVLLTLSACSGATFQAGEDDPSGLAGAGGDPGGSEAGGSAGSSTGGASQGGTAGTPGGSAGEPQAGQAGAETGGTAGDTGTGGSAGTVTGGATGGSETGGASTGGTGGSAPTCNPEDAIVFPESFAWNGFSTRWSGPDETYCGHSAGGTCALENFQVSYYDDPARAQAYANFDCSAEFSVGICGSELPCDGGFLKDFSGSAPYTWVPDGDGYRVDVDRDHARLTAFDDGSCRVDMPPPYEVWTLGSAPDVDLMGDFFDLLESMRFPCP